MTTIFGIKAFDPNINEEYLVLASDSQSSFMDDEHKFTKVASYDYNKLIENNNSVILFSGTIGTICNNVITKNETKNVYSDIFENISTKNEIIKNLKQTLKKFNNDYIIGSNFDQNLNLCSYCLKKYAFLNLSTKIPELSKSLDSVYYGSGHTYAYDIIMPVLQKNTTLTNLGFSTIISLENLINIGVKGMREASKKDVFTGGHMDLAIITKNDIKMIRKYINL